MCLCSAHVIRCRRLAEYFSILLFRYIKIIILCCCCCWLLLLMSHSRKIAFINSNLRSKNEWTNATGHYRSICACHLRTFVSHARRVCHVELNSRPYTVQCPCHSNSNPFDVTTFSACFCHRNGGGTEELAFFFRAAKRTLRVNIDNWQIRHCFILLPKRHSFNSLASAHLQYFTGFSHEYLRVVQSLHSIGGPLFAHLHFVFSIHSPLRISLNSQSFCFAFVSRYRFAFIGCWWQPTNFTVVISIVNQLSVRCMNEFKFSIAVEIAICMRSNGRQRPDFHKRMEEVEAESEREREWKNA